MLGPPDPARSAIPRRRSLPPALGIIRSRTGNGREAAVLQLRTAARRGTPRRPSTPRWRTAVSPSTPAVRAPLLPRTRSQATSRNARVGDEVEQIIEPAMRIIAGPTVQFGLDLPYPSLRRDTAASLQIVGVHRRQPPGIPVPLCRLAGPLRHVPASRGLGLLRGLRPTPRPSVGNGPAHHRTGCPAGRATADGSHVHHRIDR